VATQIVATLIAVYGLFMTPIGWTTALLVWAYVLLWFLLSDVVKHAAYRLVDPPPSQGGGGGRTAPAIVAGSAGRAVT